MTVATVDRADTVPSPLPSEPGPDPAGTSVVHRPSLPSSGLHRGDDPPVGSGPAPGGRGKPGLPFGAHDPAERVGGQAGYAPVPPSGGPGGGERTGCTHRPGDVEPSGCGVGHGLDEVPIRHPPPYGRQPAEVVGQQRGVDGVVTFGDGW